MKTKVLILVIVLFSSSFVNAQMECRSTLGAHLSPLYKDAPLSWAVEGTVAPGLMTSPYDSAKNATLNGGMFLVALNYSFNKRTSFYVEGGYKNWTNSALVSEKNNSKGRHLGMRQIFYSYSNENTKIKIGLHEARMGDFFLLDERVLGASFDKEINAFKFGLRAGTVSKGFARMGKFCSNRHLYGVIHPDYTENIGEKIAQTNLSGLFINWNPHYKKPKKQSNSDEFSDSDDEFSSNNDEFHENHDFNEFTNDNELKKVKGKKNPFVSISNLGFILYDEFGEQSYIPDNKLYTGALVDFKFTKEFFLQTGPIYQNMKNNNAIVYIVKFGKSKVWNNASQTKVSAAFIGKYNIDKDAIFQPLFSNLFLGEIMRMDVADFPLWQASIKHRFPGKLKFHIAIKSVAQIENPHTNEQNIEFGLFAFKKHLKVTLVGSTVQTELLPNRFYTTRLELRMAF